MIRKLTKKDDLQAVASLIYNTDPFLFPLMFGKDEKKALSKIVRLVELEDNYFSYQNAWVFLLEEKISGMCILYRSDKETKKKLDKNILKTFSVSDYPRLMIASIMMALLSSKGNKETLYIETLSVDKNCRGEGIGSKLLDFVFQHAKKEKYENVSLDVSTDNPNAEKLYSKLGFITKHKKVFPLTSTGVNYMCKNVAQAK